MGFSSQSNLLLFKRRAPTLLPHLFKPFSSLPQPEPQPEPQPPPPPPKPSSLSARMSFVFDQIDAIKREHGEKDETLQRIRAWREAKHQSVITRNAQNAEIVRKPNVEEKPPGPGPGPEPRVSMSPVFVEENGKVGSEKDLVLTHPWPEWMELIERLVKQNYFDLRRRDEDVLIESSGFRLEEGEGEGEEKWNPLSDWRSVETAVLNFGRDRFDIMRYAAPYWLIE